MSFFIFYTQKVGCCIFYCFCPKYSLCREDKVWLLVLLLRLAKIFTPAKLRNLECCSVQVRNECRFPQWKCSGQSRMSCPTFVSLGRSIVVQGSSCQRGWMVLAATWEWYRHTIPDSICLDIIARLSKIVRDGLNIYRGFYRCVDFCGYLSNRHYAIMRILEATYLLTGARKTVGIMLLLYLLFSSPRTPCDSSGSKWLLPLPFWAMKLRDVIFFYNQLGRYFHMPV